MATKVINLGELALGSVDRLQFVITKDGVPWAGIDSVTLTFDSPGRVTTFDRSASVLDDAAGTWYYDTAVTDFPDTPTDDNVGYWKVRVKSIDGAVVKNWPYEIGFEVLEQP